MQLRKPIQHILVVSCPATPETHHLVDRAVIAALGRDGILINIARGTITFWSHPYFEISY